MKDDLPDLTPYLSKKGGNSQGKGADNPAGKADISSKLSALVKKTDTPSTANVDAVSDNSTSALADSSSGASAGQVTATSSSSWEQVDSFSTSARFEAEAEALAQEKAFTEAAAGVNGDADYTPDFNESQGYSSSSSAPSAVSPPAQSDNSNSSNSGTFSTSGNFSTSGTFSTKPVASRPVGPAPSIDKFRAPQARPMNTLSTGSAPIQLKVPDKEPTRAPAPYTFHPSDAPREAVVPKSMQLPTPTASTASAPGSAAQAKRVEVSKDPPPSSWPAQPTAPQRIVEKVEKVDKIEKIDRVEKIERVERFESRTEQPAVVTPQPKVETTAELLAKAFMEEAKALEQGEQASDDLLESAPSEPDSKYDSPYFESIPAGSLGFGNLLSAGTIAQEVDSEPQQHSNLADLMIPTGEHQALFAADRRGEDENISPFDEVQPAHSFGQEDSFSIPASALAESVRVDEKPAPAFSSLFSTEIVTSGQDFGPGSGAPSNFLDDIKEVHPESESHVIEQATMPNYAIPESSAQLAEDQASPYAGVLSQSDAISKLLAAVNKEHQTGQSTDIASSFSDPAFTQSNFSDSSDSSNSSDSSDLSAPSDFSDPDDMRTADTMFGSGGSNKGSSEELSAADAVFGAVPELGAPSLEMVQAPETIEAASAASVSATAANAFLDQPALGKDSLPMAFADSQNFEQESLESIKAGIKKAKAEEKARKKAEEESRAQEESKAKAEEEAKAALVVEAAPEVVKPAEPQSPKSTAKLSLTEMIELANSAKLEQVNEGRPTTTNSPISAPAPAEAAKSSLSSLLSGASDTALEEAKDDDEDEGDSLGGAISDALDKLLAAGQEELSPAASSDSVAGSEPFVSSSFANSSFNPSFADASQVESTPAASNANPSSSQNRFEAFASTPNQVEEEQPLTQTQANKVDALSRLLEVASKAPNKSPDDKRTPSDSASKMAAEVNKPQGKISRQVDTIPADYGQSGQGAAMSSPFGGSSPFSSPFNSPSASQTRPASQDPSVSSGSGSGMANPYDGVSSMPQATVSNDAVSARIAALNRKLEEQSRPPSASAVNMEAMAQIQQQAEAQALSQSQTGVGTNTGSSPSVNSLSQLPSQVDDSPSTRAELVNRILGSAKISQHGTKMPELPTRTVSENITPEQTAAIRGGKGNSQTPNRTRTRVRKMPGFDAGPIIAIVVLLAVLGGGYYAYTSGIIKVNLPDIKGGADSKVSIDQLIKSGELDRAREILEAKVNSGKISASEGEKLHSLYYQMANKVDDEDPAEAIKLLEKIPSRSKKFKDAQKLLRKLKRKVKKN